MLFPADALRADTHGITQVPCFERSLSGGLVAVTGLQADAYRQM